LVRLVAVNPEAPPDPELETGVVGRIDLAVGEEWSLLQGTAVLSDVASSIVVVLAAGGDGTRVCFDDISVEVDLPLPRCGPQPGQLTPLEGGRPAFDLGIVSESLRSPTDAGRAALAGDASRIADLVNIFVHVRWNAITGRPLLDGFENELLQASQLRRLGIGRMLTFDLTHDSLAGIGHINPRPDGEPVGRLDDPGVAEAYLDELDALVGAIDPEIVSVGIETDLFYERHPDQWDAFRDMLCAARARLKAEDPALHITTYFILDALVRLDGTIDPDGAEALRRLEPCIDSIGYSVYPADGTRHLDDYPNGYLSAASTIVPGLPLIVPECGFRSDAPYSEAEQEAFLRRLIAELENVPTRAVVWYSLYDQTYLGIDASFQEAFRHIGLRSLDGAPKASWALLRDTHALRRHRRSLEPPGGIACQSSLPPSKPARIRK
jgi:hypothetical protein